MKILNSPFFLWLVLALPLVPMIAAISRDTVGPDGQPVTEMLLHPTGEFVARFMIAAMIVSR